MSSRKKRNQGEQNGSSRTLDGRRIRTVNEAKALAEYLAIKPEMDKRDRDERRKRLEDIVKSTEARKAEILNGNKGKLDGEWLESKEEAAEKAREAVLAALKAGDVKGVFGEQGSDTSEGGSEDGDGSESEDVERPVKAKVIESTAPRKFFGWDEDELSDSEDDETTAEVETGAKTSPAKSKGTAKA
jgi:hypothetical protein